MRWTHNAEFANIDIAAELILWSTDAFVLALDFILQTPTADDIVFGTFAREEAVPNCNTQYRVLPYLAALNNNDEWFWQNYIQVDAVAKGDRVHVNNDGQHFDQIAVLE